jgi:hypothetical protein
VGRIRINFYDKPEILPFPETKNLNGTVKLTVSASQIEPSRSRNIGVYITDKNGRTIPMPDYDLALIDPKTDKEAARQGIEGGRAYFPNVASDRYLLELKAKEDKKTPGPPLNVGLM